MITTTTRERSTTQAIVGAFYAFFAITSLAQSPVPREYASEPARTFAGPKEPTYSNFFEGSRYLVDGELGVYAVLELRDTPLSGWDAVKKALGGRFSDEILAPGTLTAYLYNQTDSTGVIKVLGLSTFIAGDLAFDEREVRGRRVEVQIPARSFASVELGPIPVAKFSTSVSATLSYEYAGEEGARPLRMVRVPREAMNRVAGLQFPWLRDEICSGDSDWNYVDGCRAWREEDYALAHDKLRPLATEGHAWAQWLLGFMHQAGQGCTRDPIQAADWYRRSAELGNVRGRAGLAALYAQGLGVERDYARALALYRWAAEDNDPLSIRAIGVMYEKGEGVASDSAEAARWFRKAADLGFPPAQHHLGNMYYEGSGVPKDIVMARHWWGKAAAQGALAGTYSLAGTRDEK